MATREGDDDDAAWGGLVRQATDQSKDLSTRSTPGAVLVVKPPTSDRLVAFCFGSGRFLLRPKSYVLGFGLRASLNAAVASGPAAIESLGWISFRTGETEPIDGRLRGTTPKTMLGYGVTPGLDQVRGVRASQIAHEVGVGRSLEGATSLGFGVPADIAPLPALAARLVELGLDEAFRTKWPHVDDLVEIEDPDDRDQLDDKLVARLQSGDRTGISLGLPDLAEGYSGVSYGHSTDTHDDFDLAGALRGWRGGLTGLKSRKVEFAFDDGRPTHGERLYDLMVATEILNSEEVHLTDGGWFYIRAELLKVVDAALDEIPEWDVELPVWDDRKNDDGKRPGEGNYLIVATRDDPSFLLMDRKNISTPGATAMEVCDLAHTSGAMVHVKKLDTKGISHLAAQIHGSATRWAKDLEYRQEVFGRIRHQAKATGKDIPTFEGLFEPSQARNRDHAQVIAIAADWRGRALSQVISTLAKLQLYRAISDLASRGYEVRMSKVERVE